MRKIPLLAAFLAALLLLSACEGGSFVVSAPPEDYQGVSDGFRYYRSCLTGQERYLYDQLLAGIQDQKEEITGLYPDVEMLQRAAQAIYADYPELFWFGGTGQIETTQISGRSLSSVYRPVYTMTEAEREEAQAAVDQWTAECLASLPQNATDYETVKGVYDYIIAHTEYDKTLTSNTIVNIMAEGRGLCGCYAKVTQYLLNMLGVDCAYITGESQGEHHAWNLVWVEGTPCWVDTTWGDATPGGEAHEGPAYEYLCIPTTDLLVNHTISDAVPVPDCTSDAYTYYRQNDCYFETYDPQGITAAITRALAAGEEQVSLRFASSIYPDAANQLFQRGDLREFFQDAAQAAGVTLHTSGSLWYTRNDQMGAVALTVPY
jgi:hypothetical protein